MDRERVNVYGSHGRPQQLKKKGGGPKTGAGAVVKLMLLLIKMRGQTRYEGKEVEW